MNNPLFITDPITGEQRPNIFLISMLPIVGTPLIYAATRVINKCLSAIRTAEALPVETITVATSVNSSLTIDSQETKVAAENLEPLVTINDARNALKDILKFRQPLPKPETALNMDATKAELAAKLTFRTNPNATSTPVAMVTATEVKTARPLFFNADMLNGSKNSLKSAAKANAPATNANQVLAINPNAATTSKVNFAEAAKNALSGLKKTGRKFD